MFPSDWPSDVTSVANMVANIVESPLGDSLSHALNEYFLKRFSINLHLIYFNLYSSQNTMWSLMLA